LGPQVNVRVDNGRRGHCCSKWVGCWPQPCGIAVVFTSWAASNGGSRDGRRTAGGRGCACPATPLSVQWRIGRRVPPWPGCTAALFLLAFLHFYSSLVGRVAECTGDVANTALQRLKVAPFSIASLSLKSSLCPTAWTRQCSIIAIMLAPYSSACPQSSLSAGNYIRSPCNWRIDVLPALSTFSSFLVTHNRMLTAWLRP